MKAKHLMTMVALPALFAACAQEELVESTAVGLEGRALLDPNFSINVVGEGVESRFSWNEAAFGWNAFTANDKFSAGLVDDLAGGIQDKVLTNYVFSSANNGASYTTTSQMVEGAYFFYSYPGFESNEKAAEVAFDLTSQKKIDLNDAAATVNANQLFVSPLYSLKAGHANIELPLYFVSYWSTFAVKVKNTTGEAFKIRRITLSDATGKFDVKGKISVSALNTLGMKYSWSDDADAYVLPTGKTNANMLTANIAASGATQQDVITVDCQSYELANGAETTAYIQVPAGRHTADVTVEVVVETVNALGATILKNVQFTMVDNADTNADGVNDAVDFKRGYTIPAYGIENNGVKAYAIDKIKLSYASSQTGEYADSYQALEEILLKKESSATVPTLVAINNLGGLQLDDNVMYLLSNLRYAKPSFLNPIEITSIGKGIVKNAEFKKGATVVAGDITLGYGVTVDAGETLTIDAETAATIATNLSTSTIANNGTLTLADAAVPTIVNGANSNMVVAENITLSATNVNAPKYLTVNTGKTLTLGITNALVVSYGKKVTNYGTITSTSDSHFVVEGTIDNYGTINKGTLKGSHASDNVTDQVAVINNYGKVANVWGDTSLANAVIYQKNANAEVEGVTGNGEIDNTNNGLVTNSAFTVYASYEGDQTGKLGNVMAATKVILKNGTWTNPELPAGITNLDLNTVVLTSTSSISLPNVTTLSLKSSTVSKTLVMELVTAATLESTTFNAPVSMSTLATLNLKAMTINQEFTTAATAISILGGANANDVKTTTISANLVAGTVATLNINANAKLDVASAGSLGTAGTTVVTNNGSVVNRGTISGLVAGSTIGTWKGNAISE